MPLSTPILQLADRDPISIDVNRKVSEAAHALSTERFHHLPVVDGRRLVGMLSTSDLLRLSAELGVGDSTAMETLDRAYRLEDIMQKSVITVSHRATVGDAARLLSAGGFHAVPVVDAQEHLVGVITTTDLIAHMLEAPEAEDAPAVSPQRLRLLEHVLTAVEAFLHSGMAGPEQARLERAIMCSSGV
jgi:CBS domain-containing protein